MTIELHERIEVRRSPSDCYRYLSDFSTVEQWDSGVYRARKRTPGAPAVGTEFEVTLRFAGRRIPMQYRIARLQRNERIELSGEGDGFSVAETIVVDGGGDASVIDYRLLLDFGDGPQAPAALIKPWLGRMGRRAVAGLRRALEPAASPPELGVTGRLADRTLLPAMVAFTERGYLAMPDKGLTEFMDGRQAVVTGATGGIGHAVACELARLGADVALVGRDARRLADARRSVIDFAGCDDARVSVFEADLASMGETREVAHALGEQLNRIDVLVNNAGALFAERELTDKGHECTLAINLLAPFVLTRTLLPRLRACGARVINVSSGGMYLQRLRLDDMAFANEPYDGAKAYARAKRALVALTEHWAREYAPDEVSFNSMHPGWVATPGVADSLPGFNRAMGRWLRDARMGADTIVWLASAEAVAGKTGRFWFDRRPHPTDVLPGTRVSETQRVQLMRYLERAAPVS